MFETDIMISRRTKDDIKSDIEYKKFIRSASIDDIKDKVLSKYLRNGGGSGWWRRRRLVFLNRHRNSKISNISRLFVLWNPESCMHLQERTKNVRVVSINIKISNAFHSYIRIQTNMVIRLTCLNNQIQVPLPMQSVRPADLFQQRFQNSQLSRVLLDLLGLRFDVKCWSILKQGLLPLP